MSSPGGLPDQFLLDLFREEVRTNVQTLGAGLVGLEQSPDNTELIEPLMRSAHSIKGAARVVNVAEGVRLAHVMEELLVTAQHAKLRLTSGHVDLLLRGVDLLSQIGDAVGPSLPAWRALHAAELDALVHDLEAASAGQPVETMPVSPSAERPAAIAGTGSSRQTGTPRATQPPVQTTTELPASPLLDLFRTEVLTQADVLRNGLIELEGDLTKPKCWTRLINAARAARSASNVVGVVDAARLTLAVESLLQAAQSGAFGLDQPMLVQLQAATELLADMAQAAGPGYPTWLATNQPLVTRVVNEFEAHLPGDAPTVSDPAASDHIGAGPGKSVQTAATRTAANAPPSRPTTVSPSARTVSSATRAASPAPPTEKTAAHPAVSSSEPAHDSAERVVRVTAQSLTRLMGLAGESLVEARWLPVFANSLVKLKKQQSLVTDLLDDIGQSLPDTDTDAATRTLINDARQRLLGCQSELAGRIGEFENHARQSDDLNSRLYHEVIASRMRPLADGVHGFPRMVRDLSRQLGKQVQFDIQGQTTPVDRDILEKLEAPLTHLLRNAIDHGLETPAERTAAGKPEAGTLCLTARHNAGMLSITISDDGRGIDLGRLRNKIVERDLTNRETATRMSEQELLDFLFLPGFSTREHVTEVSGRGVGLDVVHSMIHGVGGSVRIQTQPGRVTAFHLQLPITLSVIRAVLVRIANEPYAFPHNRIDRLFRLPGVSVTSLEHRQFCNVDGRNVGLVVGRQVFQLPDEAPTAPPSGSTPRAASSAGPSGDELSVVLFSNHNDQFGLVVDAFLGEQDLVVRTLDPRLGRVPNIQAAAILDDGSPILIVDLDDLRSSIERVLKSGKLQRTDQVAVAAPTSSTRRILVVDDSITVREVQRQLLAGHGYDVEVAVDGAEGWNRVREQKFDLVISDIDMPRMNGFEFVRSLKLDSKLQSIPVIIVSYKEREADRLRGLEAGADYYLTKSSFHDESLLQAVEDLIGGPAT